MTDKKLGHRESQLLEKAERNLARVSELTDAEREVLRTHRAKMMNFALTANIFHDDPAQLASLPPMRASVQTAIQDLIKSRLTADALSEVLAEALPAKIRLSSEVQEKILNGLLARFQEDVVDRAAIDGVTGVLRTVGAHSCLVSRNRLPTDDTIEVKASDIRSSMWVQTGFGSQCKTFMVQIGTDGLRELAFDDSEHMLFLQSSSAFFEREFGIALVIPVASPLQIDPGPSEISHDARMSDDEMRAFADAADGVEHALREFDQEQERVVGDATKIRESNMKVLDLIKYVSIRLPRFDRLYRATVEANPVLGGLSLEGIYDNPGYVRILARDSLVYLRRKLSEEAMQRRVAGEADEAAQAVLRRLIDTSLMRVSLIGTPPDKDVAVDVLRELVGVFPGSAEQMTALVDESPDNLAERLSEIIRAHDRQ